MPAATSELPSPEEIAERLDRVLAASTADETELVWLEVTRGSVSDRGARAGLWPGHERTVAVRVLDRGGLGCYRTGAGTVGELENAVRHALAQARVEKAPPRFNRLAADATPLPALAEVHDPEVRDLVPSRARDLLRGHLRHRETALLDWAAARVVVHNSNGVARRAEVTLVTLEARCGSGRAAASARRLADLPLEEVFARARDRQAAARGGDLPAGRPGAVVSPEAVAVLADLLSRIALSASAYREGTSFLREHLGVQVFDRAFHLLDDATDPAGLPFPFDLEGTAKRPLDLIRDGVPVAVPTDQRHAVELGLPATGHATAGNDAQAANLFVLPGGVDDEGLLERAEGGVWLGWISRIECLDPRRIQFRAQVRGARRIADGRLGEGLGELVWDDSLLRVFASLAGVGAGVVRWAPGSEVLGGVSAPAVALAEVDGLRPDP